MKATVSRGISLVRFCKDAGTFFMMRDEHPVMLPGWREGVGHLFRSVFLDSRKVVNDDLGNFLKIAVGGKNWEPVLHGAGGNPDIVPCHRSCTLLEEGLNDGPSIRSFVVDC